MYKIEIWQFHSITETFENKDVRKVVKWFNENWKWSFENVGCSFVVYKDNRELSFHEEYELGFHD